MHIHISGHFEKNVSFKSSLLSLNYLFIVKIVQLNVWFESLLDKDEVIGSAHMMSNRCPNLVPVGLHQVPECGFSILAIISSVCVHKLNS